jgi:hypothetical protein
MLERPALEPLRVLGAARPSRSLSSSRLGIRSAPRFSTSRVARISSFLIALYTDPTLTRNASAASAGVTSAGISASRLICGVRGEDAALRKRSSKPSTRSSTASVRWASASWTTASKALRIRRSSALTCCLSASPRTRPGVSIPSPSSRSRSRRYAWRYDSAWRPEEVVTRSQRYRIHAELT